MVRELCTIRSEPTYREWCGTQLCFDVRFLGLKLEMGCRFVFCVFVWSSYLTYVYNVS